MNNLYKVLILFYVIIICVPIPVCCSELYHTEITATFSGATITTDSCIQNAGYFINEKPQVSWVPVSTAGDTISIRLSSIPHGMLLKTVVDDGEVRELIGHPVTITVKPHTEPLSIKIHLSLIEDPNVPPVNPFPGFVPSVTPELPIDPETPSDPSTPGSDEPGSSDPYSPILPPAGSVHSIVGFIPLAAGFFLLFLLFAFRGHLVYRILRKHAKQHCDEMPEKQQLKETAAAVISLIRDERAYPEWRTDSVLTERLKADIIRTLSEKQYPPTVPRDAVVAEIVKAAKGRINRHRL